ncbi:unnamed protein product [Lactuca virosa]|uniref:Uncharacterized protein n=1 Tax=Lactuca virosa TaxID=75947 RepID=A0AAU9N2U6_9ASTR|nr:unnamed protein product [Lactuca virosa]
MSSNKQRPNNQPISVVANPTELMLPFYVRYVNWTLSHQESPPRQHTPVGNSTDSPPPQHSPVQNSPPVVASPPRRKKYKSETSSTESGTNASSSQHPEIERTYMPRDTSTRLKKDEPNTGFGEEEEEEMINEEEEETYYHGTQLNYDDIGSHGLEGEVGHTPTHVEPSLDVGEHHTKIVTPIIRPQRKRGVPWYQRTPLTVMQSTPKVKKITKTRKKITDSGWLLSSVTFECLAHGKTAGQRKAVLNKSSIPHKCYCYPLVYGSATFRYLESRYL